MLTKMKAFTLGCWRAFRRLPGFWQLVLIVPVVCGAVPYLLIGNMGLALMGSAVPIYTFVVGWVGGLLALLWGKARASAMKQQA